MHCTNFGYFWPSDSRKEVENEIKFTDEQTDDGQWMNRKAHLNLQESKKKKAWAKNKINEYFSPHLINLTLFFISLKVLRHT